MYGIYRANKCHGNVTNQSNAAHNEICAAGRSTEFVNLHWRPFQRDTFSKRVAEVRVSRTHHRLLRTTAGLEDREGHRSPGTSFRNYNSTSIIRSVVICSHIRFEARYFIAISICYSTDTAGEGGRVRKQACPRFAQGCAGWTSITDRPQCHGRLRYI